MPTVDFERRVDSTLASIESNDDIHPDNKALINDFKRDLKLDGLSDGWLQKLTSHLKVIAEHLGQTRFEDMDKEDVKDLVEWAQNRTKEDGEPIADATVNAYKQVIKRFWRWMHDMPRGEHPEEVDWINTTSSNGSNGKLPKDLLDPKDIDALKDACRNPRDRAFIGVLYESGARIGELIDLTVGDIEDPEGVKGYTVVIDGKTGQRRLRILEQYDPLKKWLNEHPNPKNDSPLWCQLRDADSELSYHYIKQKLLVRAGERAAKADPQTFADDPDAAPDDMEFHKPLNPHHFRHSRASYLAAKDEFNEYKLCEWFGWVIGSDVPAKYVHLSGSDIDAAYERMHGLEPEEDDDSGPSIVECWRCGEINETDARFCSRCGSALDEEGQQIETEVQQDFGAEKILAEMEESGDLTEEQIEKLANDDEIFAKFLQARAERTE